MTYIIVSHQYFVLELSIFWAMENSVPVIPHCPSQVEQVLN